MGFRFACQVKEEHGQPLFGVQFNPYYLNEKVFATVGSNRATVFKCNSDCSISPLQVYSDADPEEMFYTCAWTYDAETGESLLAIAGAKGLIRIVGTSSATCRTSYSGHGNAINELKVHTTDPCLLLSASKDHTLRLWNLKTSVCVAIFGGVDGHRDEVLSTDFNFDGTCILSSGMDHALKMWKMDVPAVQKAIKDSYEYQLRVAKRSFKPLLVHYPFFSTREVHRNYVDCVRWFGQLALSKSCENAIVLWKPPETEEVSPIVLHRLEVTNCDIWYIRFCLDYEQSLLVLGNQVGKVFVWDMMVEDPTKLKPLILSHPKCNTAIRQVTASKDGSCLVAVCDNGTAWRWDKKEPPKKA